MGKRSTGLAGLGFAIVYFVYVTMLDSPDISTSSRDAVEYWSDSGNRTQSVIAATMCGIAILLLIGFVVGLGQRLDGGGAGAAANGVRVAGAVTASLLLVGGALFASPALALSLNNESVPIDNELGLAIRASSFVAHPIALWFAAFGGAALVAATTAGSRALGWRRWTIVVGAIVAVTMLAPLVFFGPMLLLLWIAVVSISMLLSRSRQPAS